MATTMTRPPTRAVTMLTVPKRTGSLGDTLIAWGLAIVAGDVTTRDVELSDTPEAFTIAIRAAPDQLAAACVNYQPSARTMLPWLASTEKQRLPPPGVSYSVDRDTLRDDYTRLRERGQRPDEGGDAPAMAGDPLTPKYPLFRVLTNPAPQWDGFGTLVERSRAFWTPDGVQALLHVFAGASPETSLQERLTGAMQQVGLTSPGDRYRNPPGFIFPGANKGPTMRLHDGSVVIGQGSSLDWMLVDRGDLSTIELYLAYVGYFAVGVVLDVRGSRVTAVPVPRRVLVPRVLNVVNRVQPRAFPNSPPAAAADAVLAYAAAALEYVAELRQTDPATSRSPLIFSGVQLSYYWMPSGNTYAVDHVSFAPLPRWLGPLTERDGDPAQTRDTLVRHRAQVRGVGRAEGGEAREAALAYREALSSDARAWLRTIPVWYQAVLAERFVGSWSVREIERIAVALQPELTEIIQDPAFDSLTGALRRVTVQAHYSRQQRRGGDDAARLMSDRPGSRLSPQYDLIGTLREAADRHPDEFLRELCEFVADYNNEAMRREGRLIRKEDLEQVLAWIRADRRGIIPALLLAFGVSPRRRPAEEETAASVRPGADSIEG